MHKKTDLSSYSMLKLQIGPIQDFIAAARSTRDLWSGSYLLSWLMAEGIKTLLNHEVEIIFPTKDQPLISCGDHDDSSLLIPNLPNIFVSKVPANKAEEIAKEIEESIQKSWEEITKSVWDIHHQLGISEEYKERFDHQREQFLSIAWQITPCQKNYAETYRDNGWHLNGTRQLRDFQAPFKAKASLSNEKDSLTGTLEEIKINHQAISKQYKHLFKHENDHLSAITLVKRLWHLTYLGKGDHPKADPDHFPIPSIPDLAAREKIDERESSTDERSIIERYVAAIAFDGDSIGKWMGGTFHTDDELEKTHHDFSKYLSNFALHKVPEIITGNDGFLIYAGGDDVLALVPADTALDCAEELRVAFQESTKPLATTTTQPDASVGIAIAHVKSPLQDLVKQAIKAEKRAKNHLGRSAFSIHLMKRSGEINQWGGNWQHHGLELYNIITNAIFDKSVSNRFPNRVCQLLEPYLEQKSTSASSVDQEIILKEVTFAATQQGSKEFAEKLLPPLRDHLKSITITTLKRDKFQHQLDSIIGLCKTAAFTLKNQKPEPQESQQP